jgi:hypothetical protein
MFLIIIFRKKLALKVLLMFIMNLLMFIMRHMKKKMAVRNSYEVFLLLNLMLNEAS